MGSTNTTQLQRVHTPNVGNFKKGNPGGPGRPKGSRTRMQADLAQMILTASAETGFIVLTKKGQPIPGEGGTLGWLKWLALHEPKVYASLLARVLPYHVIEERPENRVLTREEAIEEMRERGLPVELLTRLRSAPEPLDMDEDPDPYGSMKDVTPVSTNGGGTEGSE